MARVVLAMSGGVDSSVAAHLLQRQGHEVIGVFMRHGEQAREACEATGPGAAELLPVVTARGDHKQGCCSASDAADARRVADRLQIPFYALNLEAEFRQIIDYFVDQYSTGRTPNPCVMCNNWLKFGKLFDYADAVGAQFVATGHYARLVDANSQGASSDEANSEEAASTASSSRETPRIGGEDERALLRGVDRAKDQSYVLFGIEQQLLSRMLLPVGGYQKPRIRQMAEQLGLRVADKRDSQEICFVTSGHHGPFVRSRRGEDLSGEIVTTDGRVVGRHAGIESFTIGQRKGLGVAMGDPHFVVRIDPDSRQVVIGPRQDLARHELTASDCNWQCEPESAIFSCHAQIRYNSQAVPARAERLPDNRLRVRFDEPCFGVAPGQAVVCYQDDRVLGGGWID